MDEINLNALHDASTVTDDDVPDKPGLYVWYWDGEPIFVGAARHLARRIFNHELATPNGSRARVSPLRERVALYLLREEGGDIPWKGSERREIVDKWLRCREIGWHQMSYKAACEGVDEILSGRLPLLHQWRPRPGEDELLQRYLSYRGGRAYVEVPIGGGQGSRERRIDAVGVGGDGPVDIRYYHHPHFVRDRDGSSIEIIEVKKGLNRTVVGQLIVAGDVVPLQWDGIGSVEVVAVVAQDDEVIHRLCDERYGIKVEVLS